MKKLTATLLIASVLVPSIGLWAQEEFQVNFFGAVVPQVLVFYREYSKQELVISSEVRRLNTGIWVQVPKGASNAELLKSLETALREQAGVILTQLDTNRTSVTYNDSLPILVVTNRRPELQSTQIETNHHPKK
jgi:hypothetical protein